MPVTLTYWHCSGFGGWVLRLFFCQFSAFIVAFAAFAQIAMAQATELPKDRLKEPKQEPKKESSTDTAKEYPRGLNDFWWGVMVGGGSYFEEKLKPTVDLGDQTKWGKYSSEQDAKYLAKIEGVAGWGPIHYGNASLISHYRYLQDWWTDPGQLQRFSNGWVSNPTADTFIFPTKTLIRRHEFASDIRYSEPSPIMGFNVSLGAQMFLAWARSGSSLLGEKLEVAESYYSEEGFSPYVVWRFRREYRGQIVFPLRTFMNRADKDQSFATYSFASVGRGRLLSVISNNEVLLLGIDSSLFFDFRIYKYKYSSLTFDRDQPSIAVSFDFPIVAGLRAAVKGAYEVENFYLPKVRVPGMHAKEGDGTGINNKEDMEPAEDFKRTDTRYSGGAGVYFDFGSKNEHRLFFDFSWSKAFSTVSEYNSGTISAFGGYRWAFPSASQVERRVSRFQEGTYAGEF